jgi:hypothetical protein
MFAALLAVICSAIAQNPPAPPPPPQPAGLLTLEVRVFAATEEVTNETRISVHRAGERGEPMAKMALRGTHLEAELPQGIYDIQAIRVQDERVISIRWAERLVLMPYPDEQGRHLEVVNFKNGFGGLQVRSSGTPALHTPGNREKPVAEPRPGPGYTLFVVPAGTYDLHVSGMWHTGIEVPADRMRLWIGPPKTH